MDMKEPTNSGREAWEAAEATAHQREEAEAAAAAARIAEGLQMWKVFISSLAAAQKLRPVLPAVPHLMLHDCVGPVDLPYHLALPYHLPLQLFLPLQSTAQCLHEGYGCVPIGLERGC